MRISLSASDVTSDLNSKSLNPDCVACTAFAMARCLSSADRRLNTESMLNAFVPAIFTALTESRF